ncbi:hypothetical protein FIBSPDRAFT_733695 [Athelia psychrophila]|uniref:Uncharacterized protein n=1 Tax=Athelia psychrophila TaxID=1759441 RepID=A0A166NX71_9AGAM|nr:hypothetical protein FIBSPDRAFT_733695 [Fibularhizoctonia sp. CBS 109695]
MHTHRSPRPPRPRPIYPCPRPRACSPHPHTCARSLCRRQPNPTPTPTHPCVACPHTRGSSGLSPHVHAPASTSNPPPHACTTHSSFRPCPRAHTSSPPDPHPRTHIHAAAHTLRLRPLPAFSPVPTPTHTPHMCANSAPMHQQLCTSALSTPVPAPCTHCTFLPVPTPIHPLPQAAHTRQSCGPPTSVHQCTHCACSSSLLVPIHPYPC